MAATSFFIDTSGFFALLSAQDRDHRAAGGAHETGGAGRDPAGDL